jgi:drug/metabolite transporter (DMT)-like permease
MVIFLNVLTRLEATQAGLANYMIPFFGVVIAAVVLGERLTAAMVAGGVLVLASTLLITIHEERQRSSTARDSGRTSSEGEPYVPDDGCR